MTDVVEEFGPEERDRVFKTVISKWQISRLGKKIRRTLINHLGRLSKEDYIVSHNGFLWPGERPDSIAVQTNTDTASRSIEEIPPIELARAGYLVLEAGTYMTKEDLVLEIARLYGFDRIGSNIREQITDAVDLLIEAGCANFDQPNQRIEYRDVDVDKLLLSRIYH